MAAELTVLAGDVGGSRTRLALAAPGIGVTALQSFANSSFASLEDVLKAYCAQPGFPPLHGACLAVAGPVREGQFHLSNRNWQGDAGSIAAALQLPASAKTNVINDLAAQCHALPALIPGQLSCLHPGRHSGGQALVAGIGTGFNVSAALNGVVLAAELGRTSLPQAVHRRLQGVLGHEPENAASTEMLFSGAGLVRFHQALTGSTASSAEGVVAAGLASPDSPEARTVCEWAHLLGLMARELTAAYLPAQGLFFAGSVARGVLNSPARPHFLESYTAPGGQLGAVCAGTPLWLITDDAAGVGGAARVALAAAGADV
ncbi:glucokinase [Leisingera sp. M658]|uniref:glucokinase n=1 Tax=Leisingera sp. M658 TaxID=2867015 RepID=UPI0021A75D72|nr:glucokinase [Leisingera sp. M658]UWQ73907.1 glucokinase [Leisingera sp. M658]